VLTACKDFGLTASSLRPARLAAEQPLAHLPILGLRLLPRALRFLRLLEVSRSFDARELLFAACFNGCSQSTLAPLLQLLRILNDVGWDSMVICRQIEGIWVRLELIHSPRDEVAQVGVIRVQIELIVDHDAKQPLIDEDADAAENASIGDAPQKRELLGDVVGQARLNPHIERLAFSLKVLAVRSVVGVQLGRLAVNKFTWPSDNLN
jgi:hypothetical protein